MHTAIMHANLKEIGRCLLVLKIKYRKLIVFPNVEFIGQSILLAAALKLLIMHS